MKKPRWRDLTPEERDRRRGAALKAMGLPAEAVNPCTNCGAQATRTLHGEQFCDSCYEHQTE